MRISVITLEFVNTEDEPPSVVIATLKDKRWSFDSPVSLYPRQVKLLAEICELLVEQKETK